ncbi:hypothetical protein CLCR_02147 [Cladophialophora carrionii]|uniref:Uncharacterized protein n=1 Tax=Cladophialophora carrionii TaxID=86049 RepID=A0A1C1CDB5_9EURO|nr:hypothetical protein CLCR_02147 [Cladophialophora carrionii]
MSVRQVLFVDVSGRPSTEHYHSDSILLERRETHTRCYLDTLDTELQNGQGFVSSPARRARLRHFGGLLVCRQNFTSAPVMQSTTVFVLKLSIVKGDGARGRLVRLTYRVSSFAAFGDFIMVSARIDLTVKVIGPIYQQTHLELTLEIDSSGSSED